MTDDRAHVRVDAAEALAAARALSAAGRELGAGRANTGAALAAASATVPWGRDEGGRAFESRYRSVESQVLAAWEQLAAYVESLGDAAARSVTDNLDTDEAAARGIEATRRERP
jgi:hypothetical protein